MITATALSTQSDAVDPDEDRLGGVASGRFASVLLLVRALIDFGRQMLATVQQGSDRSGLTDIKLRFRTLDLSAIVARVTRALALAAGLETRLEKLAAREPVDDESGAPSERAPRARAAKVANGGLPSAAAIAQRLREKPIGVVLEEICRALGIVPRDPLWRKAFLPILKHGGSLPFPSDEESDESWAAYPALLKDADVRARLERQAAPYLPPSGAGPPWCAI